MLEDIIEKASKEKEKNDLPTRLPSSHSKYVTHQTTFGRVRVDLSSKSEQRKMIESLYKTYDPTNERNQAFDARIWSLVDDDINSDEHNIDFYGLINAHYRNISFEKKLSSTSKESLEEKLSSLSKEELTNNYIDQLAFPELTTEKTPSQIKSKPLEKETINDLKNEQMNFIDEQYFSTFKKIEYQPPEQPDKPKRIEMPPANELNYIDQLAFSSSTSSEKVTKQHDSNNLLDINFQFRISTPKPKPPTKSVPNLNESPMDSYNPKLETMRSIKSKDYFDPPRQSSLDIQKEIDTDKTASQPAEHIREQLTKKINVRDSLGYRTFENLVPKWWTMTKAEIVDILIKQICFIRRKNSFSFRELRF
jgi:hypothetical protein